MGFNKFAVAALILTVLTLPPLSLAHNSPVDYLNAHNAYRAEMGLPPLCWNTTLERYAQRYTQSLISRCELVHSTGSPYGENLALGYGEFSGVNAVKLWGDEKANYDYDSNSCIRDMCGHYTQVIWKNTQQVGCGTARCGDGAVIISCNYYPPGNYVGERPY